MAPLQLRPRRKCADMSTRAISQRDVALVDLLDRLLGGGVVLLGDVTLAVADVDLVYVRLQALVASVSAAGEQGVLPPLGSAL